MKVCPCLTSPADRVEGCLPPRMRLVVDASMLVAEVLRAQGRMLLVHPDLYLFTAAEAWNEAEHELRKSVALLAGRGHLAAEAAVQLLDDALVHGQCTFSGLPSVPSKEATGHDRPST